MTPNESRDLARLRALAEEGRQSPLLSGPFALAWGGLAVVALLAHWASATGRAPAVIADAPQMNFAMIWLAYGGLGALASLALRPRTFMKFGAASVGNRVNAAVWTAVSILIFVITFAVAARNAVFAEVGPAWLHPRPIPELYDMILTVAFGGYAIAYAVSARFAQRALLSPLGFASYAAAAVSVLLLGDPRLYLFAAAFVLAVVVVPGAIQLAREPKSTV